MKRSNLFFKVAFVVAALICGTANAQWNYPSDDSTMVKNIKVWYPGGEQVGKIKAELWWYQPEYPYSLPSMSCHVEFHWREAGAIVCDSVKGIPILTPNPVDYSFEINNSIGYFFMDAYAGDNLGTCFLPPQHRHMADMYFTIQAPGRLSTYGSSWYTCIIPAGCAWPGRQIPTINIIADPGDFNGDGAVNISDCVYGIRYIFEAFADPVPCGDANGDCITNVSDVVYLLNYLFSGGPQPGAGCEFWR